MRKLLCVFLCVVLLLSAAVPALAEDEVDLIISDLEEFLAFAENCRLDSYSVDLTVSLSADIDLTGADFAGIPIFCGTFLGNGHTISGLEISVSGSEQGLFRYLTHTSVVRDLHVVGAVTPQGSRSTVGGIAGSNAGVISGCSFTGQVSGSDRIGGIAGINTVTGVIEDCDTEGEIYGNHFIGGMAGENAGVIRQCENAASVNTTPQQNSVNISDITIGTITGTESANTVTDIGGIAGSSSGTIRGCVNRGTVGYRHMGYNVGGVAGSHTGYLVDCENYGAISGRKEVGGIVGHMEPSILLRYETDTLQILEAETVVLSDLIDRAAMNSKSNTAAIRAYITVLENHVSNAEGALDVLKLDLKDPQIYDLDTYAAAVQTLSSSISGIDSTTRKLYQAVKDTSSDLESDMQAIADQMDVISGILESGEENLGGSVLDVSDADTAEDLTSKIEACINHGDILGDLNVGGIAGAMALENDLDPEDDVSISGDTTLNALGQVRSVVLSCMNSGTVTAKKQNAGGIVGWQSMGLIKECAASASLTGGDYTGGISGQSLGYIRSCYAKCAISGDMYVGGIAGSGTVVTDCVTMVAISGTERVGAILGFAEENHTDVQQPILRNRYVRTGGDPGAIDGISYDAQAQSMPLQEMLETDSIPELFKTVTVTFLFDDGSRKDFELTPGTAMEAHLIPEVPELAGYIGQWDGLEDTDLECVLFDLAFELSYISHSSAITSTEARSGKPLLLVIGDFKPDSSISLTSSCSKPSVSGKEAVLESWTFEIYDCVHTTAARYLIPDGVDVKNLNVYVHSHSGSWEETEFTVDGSYVVVPLECGDDGIALARVEGMELPWILIAAVAVIMISAVGVYVVWRKKTKPAAKKESEASAEA